MIKSFLHKGLKELWEKGRTPHVSQDLQKRCFRRLELLEKATRLEDLNIPGAALHGLKGPRAGRHTITVSGPWRVTFRWGQPDVYEVDLEQYH